MSNLAMSELIWSAPPVGCGDKSQVYYTFDLSIFFHVTILQFWLDELREFNEQKPSSAESNPPNDDSK